MTSFLQYVADNSSLLIEYTLQHLRIGMLAVAIGIVIGLPLGLLIAKLPFAQKPVLGLSSVMQAVPSLALMGFFIPFIGIGDKTAIVIIGLYALLPIIRNTYTGLTNIDQSMMEAARGIGMTETQILFRVQLPLALPVIMAGIRVAAVNSIGSATIAAFIGGGGLGNPGLSAGAADRLYLQPDRKGRGADQPAAVRRGHLHRVAEKDEDPPPQCAGCGPFGAGGAHRQHCL